MNQMTQKTVSAPRTSVLNTMVLTRQAFAYKVIYEVSVIMDIILEPEFWLVL